MQCWLSVFACKFMAAIWDIFLGLSRAYSPTDFDWMWLLLCKSVSNSRVYWGSALSMTLCIMSMWREMNYWVPLYPSRNWSINVEIRSTPKTFMSFLKAFYAYFIYLCKTDQIHRTLQFPVSKNTAVCAETISHQFQVAIIFRWRQHIC